MGQEAEAPQENKVANKEGIALYRLLFHSGRMVVGEIVLRNEEVVIIKDSYGARFQFPMSDVVEITEIVDKESSEEMSDESESKVSRSVTNVKRTSLGVRVAGGVVNMEGRVGGALAADVLLGANNIGGKRIFLGGQVGYRALMTGGKPLSIIPIDVVMQLPLLQGEHVPMIGANVGYGVGIANIRGGVNAGLSVAYRYHFSRTGALHVGIGAEVQQLAKAEHAIEVEPGQKFSSDRMTAVMGMMTIGVLF